MARLIRCRCCKSPVSSAASVCPRCGQPVESAISGFGWGLLQIAIGIAGLVLIGVGLYFSQTYQDQRGWLAFVGVALLVLAGVLRPPTVRRR